MPAKAAGCADCRRRDPANPIPIANPFAIATEDIGVEEVTRRKDQTPD
ncbi:hypothetical protein GCM10007919_51490 [Rhizobium indigoferae]|nr:hypothetical protein GCM10007919_51490 [Rhizobium indigoferae]